METEARPARILLVEDNPGDVELVRLALATAKVKNRLDVVKDGQGALDYLRGHGRFAQAPRPDLVLLDLNLPLLDGREVLRQIKDDPALAHLPVIVLTTSSDESDVLRSYRLHANAYITKPVDFQEFLAAIAGMGNFWLEIVKLPRDDDGGGAHA